jgi:hypothetical protein
MSQDIETMKGEIERLGPENEELKSKLKAKKEDYGGHEKTKKSMLTYMSEID